MHLNQNMVEAANFAWRHVQNLNESSAEGYMGWEAVHKCLMLAGIPNEEAAHIIDHARFTGDPLITIITEWRHSHG